MKYLVKGVSESVSVGECWLLSYGYPPLVNFFAHEAEGSLGALYINVTNPSIVRQIIKRCILIAPAGKKSFLIPKSQLILLPLPEEAIIDD